MLRWGWPPERWAVRGGLELEYRITVSGRDEGFSQWVILKRDPPKAQRFMPRTVSRYFLNQISSPRLFSHPLSLAGPQLRYPPVSFRLDFLPRKWIFMKDINNESKIIFSLGATFVYNTSLSLSTPHPGASNHAVSVCFILCALFAFSATSDILYPFYIEILKWSLTYKPSSRRNVWIVLFNEMSEMSIIVLFQIVLNICYVKRLK